MSVDSVDSIDKIVLEFIESTPILQDEDFLRRFPSIESIAIFLHESFKYDVEAEGKKLGLFQRPGVEDVRGYLELLNQGNPDAIRSYKHIGTALCYF